MGRVYQAYDPRLHRKVALKVLSRAGDGQPPTTGRPSSPSEGSARMLREARAAAALDHPNAVSIFDVGEVDGTPFIAMELIVGRSLRAVIGHAIVPWDQRLRWLVDVARALAAAHKRGLVHRDIKPENVMVREDGVVKVLDFGIARRPDAPVDPVGATQQLGLEALTDKGVLVGTPRYMSPEQMRGDALDGRSDQFAWGVLAYEVLCGKSPWRRSDDSLAALAELLTREPEPMDIDGLPPLVEATVRRALAKSHEARFPSMDDIVRALEPHASGSSSDATATSEQPTQPAPGTTAQDTEMVASSPTPAPKASERGGAAKEDAPRPARWGMVGVVAISAVVAIALAWSRVPGTTVTPPRPSLPMAVAAPTAVTDLPDPPTTDREALAAYRAAMQAYRDGVGDMTKRFQRAVELDPNMAAAHLRLAHALFQTSPSAGRAEYNRAVELRSVLSARDQAMLWAFEPFIADQRTDPLERARRLREVAERYPQDAELWYHLGLATADNFISEDIPALERSVAIDPKFARGWWQLGQGHAYHGQMREARAALDRCLEVSHAATSCLWNRICLDELDGRCEAVEADARQWATAEGKDPLGRFALAAALFARGRSSVAVDEALHQKEAVESDDERPKSVLFDRVQVAFARGNFTDALKAARELERLAAGAQAETEHQFHARAILDALSESGQTAEAAAYAAQYLKRREAWLPVAVPEDFAVAADVVPLALRALRAGGRISTADLAAQQAAWMTGWQQRIAKDGHGYIWLHGRAALAETPEDAKAALAALGDVKLPSYTPKTLVGASLGRTYLLAGRVDDALAPLERAAASCLALELPVDHTRAHLWLGRAREAKGDTAGACAAYAVVLGRWGKATPRSVSADEARARTKALACK
jgi:eukaryotic-like serine/threonine-protein kinase